MKGAQTTREPVCVGPMNYSSPKKHKKKDFYKKSRYYKETRKKVLLTGSLGLTALLICCTAACAFRPAVRTPSSAVPAASQELAGTTLTDQTELPEPSEELFSEEPVSITISAVGDCTLGTDENFDYSTSFNAAYEAKGKDYFLQNVRPIFEADDLTIANAEGTFTYSENRQDKLYAFKSSPEYAQIFTAGSVEAVTLANNHSHDYGSESFEDTKTSLDMAGISHFGYDDTAMLDIKGVQVGLVGIYELNDHLGCSGQLKTNIEKLKTEGADVIIAVFHWGNEKEIVPDSNQTQLGHMAVDLGADLVIGHHPHVLQGIEKYNGKYIVYSLGNFCFGGNSYPSDMDSMIFQQTFTIDSQGVRIDDQINVIPCSISSDAYCNNYQPTVAEGSEAARILAKIHERSQMLSGTAADLNF